MELFRLLIIYLQEQRVSIGVSVEIAIVSVLREVIVKGVLETEWQQIFAVCLFLATAALLMVVRVWLPPTFEGVDPEAQVSARIRLQKPFPCPWRTDPWSCTDPLYVKPSSPLTRV